MNRHLQLATLALCTVTAAAQTRPVAHKTTAASKSAASAKAAADKAKADTVLAESIKIALPKGAVAVGAPTPVPFASLGKVQAVLYRNSADDPRIHTMLLVPAGQGFRGITLSDEATAPSGEQVPTAVFSADIIPTLHSLVVLYYTHTPGSEASEAHGRVYTYQLDKFFLDEEHSRKLEGVRTAAVARSTVSEVERTSN